MYTIFYIMYILHVLYCFIFTICSEKIGIDIFIFLILLPLFFCIFYFLYCFLSRTHHIAHIHAHKDIYKDALVSSIQLKHSIKTPYYQLRSCQFSRNLKLNSDLRLSHSPLMINRYYISMIGDAPQACHRVRLRVFDEQQIEIRSELTHLRANWEIERATWSFF